MPADDRITALEAEIEQLKLGQARLVEHSKQVWAQALEMIERSNHIAEEANAAYRAAQAKEEAIRDSESTEWNKAHQENLAEIRRQSAALEAIAAFAKLPGIEERTECALPSIFRQER